MWRHFCFVVLQYVVTSSLRGVTANEGQNEGKSTNPSNYNVVTSFEHAAKTGGNSASAGKIDGHDPIAVNVLPAANNNNSNNNNNNNNLK